MLRLGKLIHMESLASAATRYLERPLNTVWKGFQDMADSKMPRLMKRIGTHSGVFHCDEALACFLLKKLPEYKDAEIVRTRDETILDTCDIVVDVGGVYNPKIDRYDHHQRDFEHTLSTVRPDLVKNKQIKLSSAGLIYAHFGIEVLTAILEEKNYIATTDCLHHIYLNIYDSFVEELDAIDNGIPMHPDGKPRYKIGTHLSARVHRLNPEWNEPEPESQDKLFEKAMEMVGREFTEKVLDAALVWWPAREVVKNAILKRRDTHLSGAVIELKDRCPWKDHLFSLEEELGIVEEIKFVIFHDNTDSWRVQAIPVQPDSFVCRIFLHKDWRGVRDQKLSDIAAIEGCVFCHATGFIGGNKTREGALKMALASLEQASVDNE